MKGLQVLLAVVLGTLSFGSINAQITYPEALRDPTIFEDYHGTLVADPYQWLENSSSQQTSEFIQNQNTLAASYISVAANRDAIRQRLTDLSNFTSFNVPQKAGNRYFFYAKSPFQNQQVLYVQEGLESEASVFLDPNEFSEDGSVLLGETQAFSIDGEILAYSLGTTDSPWLSLRFRNVSSGEDLPETLTKIKYTDVAWTYDNLGVFYGAFPDWNGDPASEMNEDMKIFYHRIGTSQSEDILVIEFPTNPQWLIGRFIVSNHGKSILAGPEDGAGNLLQIFYYQIPVDIQEPFDMLHIVGDSTSRFQYIGNDASFYYIRTDHGAPNYRMVVINALSPDESEWTELIPEHPEHILTWAVPINAGEMVLSYLDNVKSRLEIRDIYNGTLYRDLSLPIGTAIKPIVRRADTNFFLKFESFLTPNRIYLLNFTDTENELTIYRDVEIPGLNPVNFEIKQVFYESLDKTVIPMYIIHKKDLSIDGQSPAILYGYGGFSMSILPDFDISRILFIQNFDGVYAIANIRGGGEYGEAWHAGGQLENKQNVFDDFQYAAEYLIANQYTSGSKLTIQGVSNGGLLVGACVTQRPDLYAAAVAQVGLFDMLRYQKFTENAQIIAEYGNSDVARDFEYLYKYSPLHNIKMPENGSIEYPAVLITTRTGDDVVSPLHSLKFVAELQFVIGGNGGQVSPLLLNAKNASGHSEHEILELIEEQTDIYSFLVQAIGLTFHL